MSFIVDKQTLEELNLLGKFKQGSVYQLFNQTKTPGGEQLLHEMFLHPLQDENQINQRCNTFRYFQERDISFAFDPDRLNAMREFLETSGAGNRILSLLGTFTKKLLSNLARDDRYKKLVQGIQATILTIRTCQELVNSEVLRQGLYSDRVAEIRRILEEPTLYELGRVNIYVELRVSALARYDHLLKGELLTKLTHILSFIYELDVNIAVAGVARSHGFNFATAVARERRQFLVKDLRHPAIKGAVGNSLSLDGENNILFLTGANMAGKSTLMKSVGIAVYLAHMGFPVPASEMTFSIRQGLYTSINVADNIGLGYSHFYAEVVRVKKAAEAAVSGKYFFLMFDELFKGTNVKDAYEGTLEVVAGLTRFSKCMVVVSTHIIEVGAAIKQYNNVQFAFMPTYMDGSTPRYTYRMQEGITQDRQGMMIIRNEGILEMLNSI